MTDHAGRRHRKIFVDAEKPEFLSPKTRIDTQVPSRDIYNNFGINLTSPLDLRPRHGSYGRLVTVPHLEKWLAEGFFLVRGDIIAIIYFSETQSRRTQELSIASWTVS